MPAVVLPEQLAPALVARVRTLLAEVTLAAVPPPRPPRRRADDAPRCVVCHRPGKLGGHHATDGSVQWIHRSCHRRLHRPHAGSRRRTSRH